VASRSRLLINRPGRCESVGQLLERQILVSGFTSHFITFYQSQNTNWLTTKRDERDQFRKSLWNRSNGDWHGLFVRRITHILTHIVDKQIDWVQGNDVGFWTEHNSFFLITGQKNRSLVWYFPYIRFGECIFGINCRPNRCAGTMKSIQTENFHLHQAFSETLERIYDVIDRCVIAHLN